MISGGTETTGGHVGGNESHLSGHKLDFRYNKDYKSLNNHIYEQIGNSNPKHNVNYKGKDGNIYRFEGTHWDVCFDCKNKKEKL
jgi:hypothetical protein